MNAIDRIRSLDADLVAWWCDVRGAIVIGPEAKGSLGRFLSADALGQRVEAVTRGWLSGGSREITQVFDGCWLFAVNPPSGLRREGFLAVAGFTPEAMSAPEVREALASAGVDLEAGHRAIRSIATHTRPQLELAERLINELYKQNHAAAEEHDLAVETFSRELADTYEHVSVLFALARASARVTDPREVLQLACDQLARTLRFGWVSVAFSSNSVCPHLSGTVVSSGDMGFDRDLFGAELHRVTDAQHRDSWTQVLLPGEAKLATLADSEIAIDPICDDSGVAGMIAAGAKYGADPDVSSIDIQLIDAVADLLGVYHQNVTRHESQRAMFVGVVRALSASIDAKDPYTRGHSERVALVGREIARAAGQTEREAERVHFAGLLHDVGKIGVPEAVLRKPGKLTDEEFEHIKRHPRVGHEILKGIPGLDDILPAVLHHHERWDGRGYPHHLTTDQAPLIARIIGLADAFDAMSSNRAYRSARSRDEVLAEIERCSGTQFDPELAALFPRVDLREFDQSLATEMRKAA